MLLDLISLIFPQNCISCQRSLISEEKYLCTPCKINLPITNDHQYHDNELFQKFAFLPKIVSASSYLHFYKGGVTQKLLHELKYRAKEELGVLIGRWYANNLSNIATALDMIICVPLHKSKQRKRGYNQSESFAVGLAETLGVEVNTSIIFREIPTTAQAKKSRIKRWMDLENVYSKAHSSVEGKRVLVVDDVITTGATIGMLCSRLIEAGVGAIHITSIARRK